MLLKKFLEGGERKKKTLIKSERFQVVSFLCVCIFMLYGFVLFNWRFIQALHWQTVFCSIGFADIWAVSLPEETLCVPKEVSDLAITNPAKIF